jgi:hypothetical protein
LVNIFEERVFEDTAYSVCAFQFQVRKDIDKRLAEEVANK